MSPTKSANDLGSIPHARKGCAGLYPRQLQNSKQRSVSLSIHTILPVTSPLLWLQLDSLTAPPHPTPAVCQALLPQQPMGGPNSAQPMTNIAFSPQAYSACRASCFTEWCQGVTQPEATHEFSYCNPSLYRWGHTEGRREGGKQAECFYLECPRHEQSAGPS